MARCPAHDDERESLGLREGDDGRVLMLCYAGCPTPEVVKALGLEMRDLFADHRGDAVVDSYVYVDEEGAPLFRVLRTWPKGFTQQAYDRRSETWRSHLGNVRRVPYRLPGLLAADEVWLVEGEKDANRLVREGVAATTLPGGAGKWKDGYAEFFAGKRVNIVADNDPPDPKTGRRPGIEGALRIKQALRGVSKGIPDVWLNPHGKDVTDLLEAGFGLRDLERYTAVDDGAFEPLTWEEYETPDYEWLLEPYVPRSGRVLIFGPAGSLKSLWAMWVASQLAKEGHRVAYFSLEMQAGETAKRLKKLKPPPENFKLYRRFSFSSPRDVDAALDLFKGFSLIVVDSWSAAAQQLEMAESNVTVARLDTEVFLPLVEETGATVMFLDNTGHDAMTDKGPVRMKHARGASAKGDKVDLAFQFSRPDEADNYTARIEGRKIRYDRPLPKPITVRTHPHNIDFKVIDKSGTDTGSMWSGEPVPPEDWKPDVPASLLERLKEARDRGRLGEEPVAG